MRGIPVHWRVILAGLRRLPQGVLSRWTGRLADVPLPRALRGPVIGSFARLVGIRRDEAEAPPDAYPSVGAYFVRRLAMGARCWTGPEERPGSPVDGVVGAMGSITEGQALQAKGVPYPVADFLAGVAGADGWWIGGRFLTLYLSPRHYHRIHVPVTGVITGAVSVPGRLLPVNRAAVEAVPDLFPRNERLVVRMETGRGPLALVAVGAFNVGRISAAFEPDWRESATNRAGRTRSEDRRYDPPLAVERGSPLGAFHLGSTVVLVLGPEWEAPFAPEILPGQEVRLGQPLLMGG